jgi:phospholipid N-methyltransferase
MQQQWIDYRIFFREFRSAYHTTGAVLPSGRALSRALTRYVRDGDNLPLPRGEGSGRRILEVGPGTGAVTAQIIRDMQPHDRLTLVERNGQFVARLRQRIGQDKMFQTVSNRIELVHAGIEEIAEAKPFDVIVSGLPLNNFSVSFVEQIIAKLLRLLVPQGTFSFFEYVAIRRAKAMISRRQDRDRLHGIERLLTNILANHEVRRDRVLFNVPPAWVHHVRFAARSMEQGAEGSASASMLRAPCSPPP